MFVDIFKKRFDKLRCYQSNEILPCSSCIKHKDSQEIKRIKFSAYFNSSYKTQTLHNYYDAVLKTTNVDKEKEHNECKKHLFMNEQWQSDFFAEGK